MGETGDDRRYTLFLPILGVLWFTCLAYLDRSTDAGTVDFVAMTAGIG
ncbi:hypothetical protein [Haladaptatus sp. NG-WS-4]